MIPTDLIFFSIAILVSGLIGYLIVDLLFPPNYPRGLVLAFTPLTGFGICALIVLFFRRPMFTVEGMLLVVLLGLWIRYRRASISLLRELFTLRVSILAIIFAVTLGWAVAITTSRVERYPNGMTDGWAIWTSHAKYLASGGNTWRQDIENTFHPDYPLLVPGILVHTWRYIGSKPPDAAGFMGILFGLGGIAILAATLARLRSPMIGLLMAFVLIGTPFYLYHTATGYAEVPLSAYILGTIALLVLYEHEASRPIGLIVLAGFMAGCAAWTKNEGVPFMMLAAVIPCLSIFRRTPATLRRFAGFAVGLLVPLAAIAYFKMTAARPTDLFESRNSAELMAKVMDPHRYILILKGFRHTLRVFGGWIFNPVFLILPFIALTGVDKSILKNFSWRVGVAVIFLLQVTYFAIFVITPLELIYHIDSALDRLLLHCWPAFLLLAGMTAQSPNAAKRP